MLNKIVIMGRLTREPELRYTASQTAVASFTLAVDRDFSGNDGERQTDFINCVAWRSTGEFVGKYFHKGSMAVVSGRLQIRSYQDREGNNRTAAEVVADSVYFGESRRDSENRSSAPQTSAYGGNSYGGNSYAQSQSYPPPARTQVQPQQSGYYQPQFSELDDADGDLPF